MRRRSDGDIRLSINRVFSVQGSGFRGHLAEFGCGKIHPDLQDHFLHELRALDPEELSQDIQARRWSPAQVSVVPAVTAAAAEEQQA